MGKKCSVEKCTSDSTKPEHTGVTFHKVPPHTDIRPKWLSLCRIPADKTETKLLYVCSRHFLRADFCSFKGKKYMLRQGVLPSVFPWDKSRLEAIKAEVSIKKDVVVPKKRGPKKKEVKPTEAPTSNPEVEPKLEPEIKVKPLEIKTETEEPPNQDEPSKDTSIITPEINIEIKTETPIINEDSNNETDPFDQHQMSQNTSPVSSAPISFTINSRIEVLDNNNVWHPAKINEVDYEEDEVLIHLEKSTNKCDEWISMSSPRLRPVQPKSSEVFAVNERCMAVWSDSRKFPGTVTKKLGNGKIFFFNVMLNV